METDVIESCSNVIEQPPLNNPKSNGKKLKCKFCTKLFNAKSNRSRHERYCKSRVTRPEVMESVISISCPKCKITFTRKDSLKRHSTKCSLSDQLTSPTTSNDQLIKDTSESVNPLISKRTPCLVELCSSTFYHKNSLIKHLKNDHKNEVVVKDPITRDFPSFNDFLQWKTTEEENTFSYFSKKCGDNKDKQYYYCQHDGNWDSQRKKTSRVNLKGRIKAGHHCIAKMKVRSLENKVSVEYFPTHSHRCSPEDLVHHPLPQDVSKYINQQLSEEVSLSKVYDKVETFYRARNATNVQKYRVNTLTKKLIRNRARKLLNSQRLQEDNVRTVFSLLQEDEEFESLKSRVKSNLSHLEEYVENSTLHDINCLAQVDSILTNLVFSLEKNRKNEDIGITNESTETK